MHIPASRRKVLTLKEKVEVLNYVKKNPGPGSRKIIWVCKDPDTSNRKQKTIDNE